MNVWWLHILVFIFGYVTCKTFSFLNTASISLKILKSSRVIYLLLATRAAEQYAVSEYTMRSILDKSEHDEEKKKALMLSSTEQLETFKNNAVTNLINLTPEIFREDIGFHDWGTAMMYLQRHKAEAVTFWRINR